MAANNTQQVNQSPEEQVQYAAHPELQEMWHRRRFSRWTQVFAVFAIFFGSLFAISLLLKAIGYEWSSAFYTGDLLPATREVFQDPYLWLWTAVPAVLAIASELLSRYRFPPAFWRVKQDLQGALVEIGILSPHLQKYWNSQLSTHFWNGRVDWRAKTYSLRFEIRSIKANDETFKALQDSLAVSGFYHAEDVSVTPYRNNKNKFRGYLLTISYSPTLDVEVF